MNKFKNAFNGIVTAVHDPSVLIQLCLGIGAIGLGVWMKLSVDEWGIFILCIGIVISLEIFNTCIERISDIVQPKYHKKIKEIKDMSSAAVLIMAISSLLVAISFLLKRID